MLLVLGGKGTYFCLEGDGADDLGGRGERAPPNLELDILRQLRSLRLRTRSLQPDSRVDHYFILLPVDCTKVFVIVIVVVVAVVAVVR